MKELSQETLEPYNYKKCKGEGMCMVLEKKPRKKNIMQYDNDVDGGRLCLHEEAKKE